MQARQIHHLERRIWRQNPENNRHLIQAIDRRRPALWRGLVAEVIVDSSALVAIAMGEPDARRLLTLLHGNPMPRISAANLLETSMVIDRRRGALAKGTIAEGVIPVGLIVEPVTEAQVHIAREAFQRYGKGSGHPARLNYGDCFAYPLARYLDEPLLFVGNNFSHTDITPA